MNELAQVAAPLTQAVEHAAGVPFVTIFTVFVLAIFVGYYVVWSVTPALHTPLMAVTNAVSGIIVVGVLIVLSGLSIWKPVQFQYLTALFGGYDFARYVHFACMASICAFLVVHVTLALLDPRVRGPERIGLHPIGANAPLLFADD